jgi:iron complex outermembrane receptor protein
LADADGRFRIARLAPGDYTVIVRLAGFADTIRHVTLAAGQAVEMDIVLELASASETVDVVATARTVTASAMKGDAPLVETPQSVSVVTSDQLESRGVLNVTDSLRYTAGTTPPSRFGSAADQFSLRGFDASTTGLFRDGTRALVFVYNGTAEPYGLERVEVLRGPSSVLYGQGSPGGLINMVTKRPSAQPLREVQLSFGSFDRKQIAADAGGALDARGRVLYRVTGLFRDSGTQLDYVKDDRVCVAPALTWTPGDRTTLTVLAQYQKDTIGYQWPLPAAGTYLPGPFGQIPSNRFRGIPGFDRMDQRSVSAGYLLQHRLSDAWTVRQNLRYIDGTVLREETWSSFFPAPGIGLQADGRTENRIPVTRPEDTRAFTVDTQAQMQGRIGRRIAHTFLAGVDARLLEYDNQIWWSQELIPIDLYAPVYRTTRPTMDLLFTDGGNRQRQTGIYAQEQFKLDDRWVFVLGGRRDWVKRRDINHIAVTDTSSKTDAFTGRAGVVYTTSIGLAPYVSFSESFTPLGSDINGNPYQPETGRQYEAGVKYQPAGHASFVTVGVFDLRRQNMLTADPTNPALSIQTGEVRSRGVEIEGVTRLRGGLGLTAAITLLDLEITKSTTTNLGLRPANLPERTASLFATYDIARGRLAGVGAGVGVRYVGPTLDAANTLRTPDYTLADLNVHYQRGPWRLMVNATNLFDRIYFPERTTTTAAYGFRRTIVTNLRYAF